MLRYAIAPCLLAVLLPTALIGGEAPSIVILDTEHTVYRYHEVWATDIARTKKGDLVRVDPFDARLAQDVSGGEWISANINHFNGSPRAKEYRLNATQRVRNSPPPGTGWEAADFDDHEWARSLQQLFTTGEKWHTATNSPNSFSSQTCPDVGKYAAP